MRRSNREPCRGHSTVQSPRRTRPRRSSPSSCEQRSSMAKISPRQLKTPISRSSHSTRRFSPGGSSSTGQMSIEGSKSDSGGRIYLARGGGQPGRPRSGPVSTAARRAAAPSARTAARSTRSPARSGRARTWPGRAARPRRAVHRGNGDCATCRATRSRRDRRRRLGSRSSAGWPADERARPRRAPTPTGRARASRRAGWTTRVIETAERYEPRCAASSRRAAVGSASPALDARARPRRRRSWCSRTTCTTPTASATRLRCTRGRCMRRDSRPRSRPGRSGDARRAARGQRCAPVAPRAMQPYAVVLDRRPDNAAYWEHAGPPSGSAAAGRARRPASCAATACTTTARAVESSYRRTDADRARHGRRRGCSRPAAAGTLGIVNAFGAGVADDKLVHAYVEDMVRFYLGEEPLLRACRRYDLARPEHRERALDEADRLVFKPRDLRRRRRGDRPARRPGGVEGSAGARGRIGAYVAQPLVMLSRHRDRDRRPRCRPRHVDLRPVVLRPAPRRARAARRRSTRVAFDEGALAVELDAERRRQGHLGADLRRRAVLGRRCARGVSGSQATAWPRPAHLMTFSDSSAHLMRVAEMSIPSRSSTNSRSSLSSFVDRIPISSSEAIEAAAWEIAQPWPENATSATLPSSSTLIWTFSSSPHSGLVSKNSRSGVLQLAPVMRALVVLEDVLAIEVVHLGEHLLHRAEAVDQAVDVLARGVDRERRARGGRRRRGGASAAARSGGRRGRRRPRGRGSRRRRAGGCRRART